MPERCSFMGCAGLQVLDTYLELRDTRGALYRFPICEEHDRVLAQARRSMSTQSVLQDQRYTPRGNGYLCVDCGCLVIDRKVHDRLHSWCAGVAGRISLGLDT